MRRKVMFVVVSADFRRWCSRVLRLVVRRVGKPTRVPPPPQEWRSGRSYVRDANELNEARSVGGVQVDSFAQRLGETAAKGRAGENVAVCGTVK